MGKKQVDKVIDTNKVHDRMNVIKLLVQMIIVSVISGYAPKFSLYGCQKDNFYDRLINVDDVKKHGGRMMLVIVLLRSENYERRKI